VKCSHPHHEGIQGEYWCSSTLNAITTWRWVVNILTSLTLYSLNKLADAYRNHVRDMHAFVIIDSMLLYPHWNCYSCGQFWSNINPALVLCVSLVAFRYGLLDADKLWQGSWSRRNLTTFFDAIFFTADGNSAVNQSQACIHLDAKHIFNAYTTSCTPGV